VLFEGGSGEIVRRKLLENTDLHTILRLPTGIFYANGVKANVIFFDNREASPKPWTKEVWYYDYRTNVHHTLKKKTMRFDDLADFVSATTPPIDHKRKETWNATNQSEGKWRKFSYEELKARDKTSLDVFWLRDKEASPNLDNLPEPDELAEEIIENLEAGLTAFVRFWRSCAGELMDQVGLTVCSARGRRILRVPRCRDIENGWLAHCHRYHLGFEAALLLPGRKPGYFQAGHPEPCHQGPHSSLHGVAGIPPALG